MEILEKLNKINHEKIFYFSYFMLLFEIVLDIAGCSLPILKYFNYIVLISLIINVIIMNLNSSKKEKLKILFTLILLFIVTLVSKNKQLLKIMLLIMSFKGINFEEFLKKDFKFKVVVLFNMEFIFPRNNFST